jgi:molybdopterin-guanine dinucleotide biosynthesis protein B
VSRCPPLIGIVGWKNSGKTTLVERLVTILSRRGLKVATVKHAHHALRTPDGATDGERHARAGAVETVVLAPEGWEISGHRPASPAPSLDDLAARLSHADVVIVEGFKRAAIPKLEVRRRASQTQEALAVNDANVIAVAADHSVDTGGLPLFDLDDAEGIADFLVEKFVSAPAG